MQSLTIVVLALGLVLPAFKGCSAERPFAKSLALGTETVASGLELPVHLTAPRSDPRLFVAEQPGRIRIIQDGRVLERPFLDIRDRVRWGGEQGLLSLAFHPRYADNGLFFVYYTDLQGDTRVDRFTVSEDPSVADPTTGERILAVDQPYDNHNGGLVVFGPDGMLYVGLGDGGLGGDPHRNGQNRGVLLGKILRLDVDHALPYAIPADNPYVGSTHLRPEIWAYGLRNPWRFSFDPEGRFLYLADDGEHKWEEVNVVPANRKGVNYGWCETEGVHCLRGYWCNRIGITMPVVEYGHDAGCTMVGGLVYRGSRAPELRGHYFFADHCHGWVRSFRYERGRLRDYREWSRLTRPSVSSFGEDADGELYVLSLDGTIRRVVSGS